MARRWPFFITGVLALVLVSGQAFAASTPPIVGDAGASSVSGNASLQNNPFLPLPPVLKSTMTTKAAGPPPPSKSIAPSGTPPYGLDFTMPTLGKSGCEVCHGDPNLIRIKEGQYVSFYIPAGLLEASTHGPGPKTGPSGVLCTSCHLDFASTSQHNNANWQRTAKQACRACHVIEDQDFGKGAHSVDTRPGHVDTKADEKPLCGDCHGGHDIVGLTNSPAGRAALHNNGWQVCGRCHPNEWSSYADYYHGAAYRSGAPDAPACWDCHGAHEVLSSSDKRSPTNAANLAATCGKCHKDANDAFLSYTGLIHRRTRAVDDNPVYSWMHRTAAGFSAVLTGLVDAVRSLFT